MKKDYVLGRTKVFIRSPQTVFDLEGLRKSRLEDLALLIQKVYRGWHQKNKVNKMNRSTIFLFTSHFPFILVVPTTKKSSNSDLQ